MTKRWREILLVSLIVGVLIAKHGWYQAQQEKYDTIIQKAIDNGAAYHDPQTAELIWIKREPVKISQQRIMQTEDGKMWLESEDGTREPYKHGEE